MWNIHSCLAFSFLLQFAVCHLPVYIPPSPASLIRINHGPSSRSHFHRWQPAAAIIAAPSTKTTYVAPVAKRPPPPPPTTVIHQQVEHEIVAVSNISLNIYGNVLSCKLIFSQTSKMSCYIMAFYV